MTTKVLKEEPTGPPPGEERIWRMTQMSQDVDDGLYDDMLGPLREATTRLITDQLPDGYAYDHRADRSLRPQPARHHHHQIQRNKQPARTSSPSSSARQKSKPTPTDMKPEPDAVPAPAVKGDI